MPPDFCILLTLVGLFLTHISLEHKAKELQKNGKQSNKLASFYRGCRDLSSEDFMTVQGVTGIILVAIYHRCLMIEWVFKACGG